MSRDDDRQSLALVVRLTSTTMQGGIAGRDGGGPPRVVFGATVQHSPWANVANAAFEVGGVGPTG